MGGLPRIVPSYDTRKLRRKRKPLRSNPACNRAQEGAHAQALQRRYWSLQQKAPATHVRYRGYKSCVLLR